MNVAQHSLTVCTRSHTSNTYVPNMSDCEIGTNSELVVENRGNDLITTDKGKFKWRGDLLKLQLFLDEVLNVKGKWTTASGAKILKTEALTIRWYNQNESLTISGPDAEEVKQSLKLKAVYLNEVNPKPSVAELGENDVKARTKAKLQLRILMKLDTQVQ